MTGIELIKEITSERNKAFCIPELFLDLLDGDHIAALLLNQICYWADVKGGDWFYKTYEDWQKELRLTEYQVRTAIKILKKYGVQTTFHKASKQNTHKLHYRVDVEQLKTALLGILEGEKFQPLKISTLKNFEGRNIQETEGEKFQPLEGEKFTASINTKITTEITTKDTSSSTAHVPAYDELLITPNLTNTTDTTTEPINFRNFRNQHKGDQFYENAFQAFESSIGTLTPYLADQLKDLIKEYGEPDFILACQEAELNNKRNLPYVNGILRKCKEEGRKPGQKRQNQNSNQATYTNTGNSTGYGGYRKQYQEPRKLSVQEEIALHVPQQLKSARQLEWERQQQAIQVV